MTLSAGLSLAQSAPYASINRDAVNYNGPGREANHDLAGSEIRIGLLLPLSGPRQAQGEALRRAAQMAVDDENAASPPDRRLTLVTRDESGPWGQASTQIVNLVFDDQAVALITSGEGGSAHLAEQIGNKIGVPILTLSSDSTTTEINLPWIFRLGPTDAAQAQAFAADIYRNRKLQKVLLLSENDRDGRMGAEASFMYSPPKNPTARVARICGRSSGSAQAAAIVIPSFTPDTYQTSSLSGSMTHIRPVNVGTVCF